MSDGLFDGVLAAGPVAEQVSDRAWVQAMLDFEGALAGASAAAGVIPAEAARAIESRCRAELYDIPALGERAVGIGNPAGPLVRALTARVGPEAAGYVHLGATSQDVMDTAAMLVTARALAALRNDLRACADRLADLAETHATTVQAGRSLLQQAPPVTFGLTAANWLSGLIAALDRLEAVRGRLAVQFGGAVGTLAALGDKGIPVRAALARRLDLAEPALPWHTERSRIAEVAAALGQTCGAVAKIARDLTLLAQTEVAEVFEQGPPGTGGSSTMPHKRNPVAAVLAAASAGQAPALVAALLGASAHEYQRAAGSWHAEWRPYTELLRTTGSAVHWLRTSLDRLRVDSERMRTNLDLTGGLLLVENVAIELVSASHGDLGRQAAADLIAARCAPTAPRAEDSPAAVGEGSPALVGEGSTAPVAEGSPAPVADDSPRHSGVLLAGIHHAGEDPGQKHAGTASGAAGMPSGAAGMASGAAGTASGAAGTASGGAGTASGGVGTASGPAVQLSGVGELAARLAADPVIGKYLGQERIRELLDPARYLGSTAEFISGVLREWKERGR